MQVLFRPGGNWQQRNYFNAQSPMHNVPTR